MEIATTVDYSPHTNTDFHLLGAGYRSISAHVSNMKAKSRLTKVSPARVMARGVPVLRFSMRTSGYATVGDPYLLIATRRSPNSWRPLACLLVIARRFHEYSG